MTITWNKDEKRLIVKDPSLVESEGLAHLVYNFHGEKLSVRWDEKSKDMYINCQSNDALESFIKMAELTVRIAF